MTDKKLMTYSLLAHLRENEKKNYSSLVELFFPIVKKAIVEYANEINKSKILGKSITEIREKIVSFFGINIPLSVLDFILSQISKEVSDESVFVYNNDKSFIINSYQFSDLDEFIEKEKLNIQKLQDDYKKYCQTYNIAYEKDSLIEVLTSLTAENFNEDNSELPNKDFNTVNYINKKLKDDSILSILSDVYLGNLISSYLEYEISEPVSDTELLIDTNFYISLINLNTEEAYITCKQLFELCQKLGFRFSILYSTVDQIKYLLNSRIQDFANKDVGLTKEADIFGACIRRKLDKTDLERFKDGVESNLKRLGIEKLHEIRLSKLIKKAKKSAKYNEFLEIRNNHPLSALNDTIAYHYVMKNRGENIQEFSDVKCWFLNNSFNNSFYSENSYPIHKRFKISANELLSLLWLANPNQADLDTKTLAISGLSTYVAKFRNNRLPSEKVIKDIRNRAKKAAEIGKITDKEVYNLSVRMSEGQISPNEAEDLSEAPDEDFIDKVSSYKNDFKELNKKLDDQSVKYDNVVESNEKVLDELKSQRKENKRKEFVNERVRKFSNSMINTAWIYIFFFVILSALFLINNFYSKTIDGTFALIISLILYIAPLFIRFVDTKSVWASIKFLLLKRSQSQQIINKKEQLNKEFKNQY